MEGTIQKVMCKTEGVISVQIQVSAKSSQGEAKTKA